ncbi:O-acetylserine/cysteine exporter, partial [Serratia marcescens]
PAQFGGALLVLAGMAVNTFGLPRRRAAIAR